MRVSRIGSLLFIGSALAVAMSGCGGTATLVDPSAITPASQMKNSTPQPVVVASTPMPVATPQVMAQLQVSLKTFKKAFLGMGKSTATVEVSNPSNASLTGTIKVTFTKKGTASGTPQTQTVTVMPHGVQDMTFTASTWFLDNAQAELDFDGYGAIGSGASRPGGSYSYPGTY